MTTDTFREALEQAIVEGPDAVCELMDERIIAAYRQGALDACEALERARLVTWALATDDIIG